MHKRWMWGVGLTACVMSATALAVQDVCDEGAGSLEHSATLADASLEGVAALQRLGATVVRLGDVDGDGHDDLAAGAPGDNTYGGRAGAVLLFLSGDGDLDLSQPSVRLYGGPGEAAGAAVSAAGDVDGDGYADLLVAGDPRQRSAHPNGVVWIVRGGPALPGAAALEDAAWVTVDGDAPGDRFGASVSAAGDLDGDGLSDVAIGAPGAAALAGAVYVFFSPSPGAHTAGSADQVWTGEAPGDRAGAAIVHLPDTALGPALAIGAPDRGPGLAADGAVYLARATEPGARSLATADVQLTGENRERLGATLAVAGDTDGDGEPELWAGAPLAGLTRRGAAWLLPAAPAPGVYSAGAIALAELRGNNRLDNLGASIAGDVDLNDDGLADVVLGAPFADGDQAQTGAAWTLHGPFAGEITLGRARGRHAGATSRGLTGAAVAAMPDLDGDGFDDVIVASPGARPRGDLDAGAIHMLRGGADEVDLRAWWPDADGDGWGGAAAVVSCEQPVGYVAQSGDCNDADARQHPFALEPSCGDPIDWSCDGSTGADDHDGDGVAACDGDCNDLSADVGAHLPERCGNAVDDDCDGHTDDPTAIDAVAWRPDSDGDGFGDDAIAYFACTAPAFFLVPPVTTDGDCDDGEPGVHPSASERCNLVDDNCDGLTDDPSAVDARTWYADADHDGFGDRAFEARACGVPDGYTVDVSDCDDTRAAVHPGAPETCDAVDNDCDGAGYLGGPMSADRALWAMSGGGRAGAALARMPGALAGGRDALVVAAPGDGPGEVVVLDEGPGAAALSTEPGAAAPQVRVRARVRADRSGARFGATVAAGDFDGDGVVDLAIGAPAASEPAVGQGTVWLIYGPVYGEITVGPETPRVVGVDGGDAAGTSLLAADVDHDGADELFIGAPGHDGDTTQRGAVAAVWGGSARIEGRTSIDAFPLQLGDGPRDELGATLAWIGDVERDGLDELALGAPLGGVDESGYVRTATPTPAGWLGVARLDGSSPGQRLGTAVAGLDLDADDLPELAVSSALGRAWITPAGATGHVLALASHAVWSRAGEELGAALAADDLDLDGHDDLLIGAPGHDEAGGGAGAVFVLYGGQPLPPEIDANQLESRGRLTDGTSFPTWSAANLGVPEGARLLGPGAGADFGRALLPGFVGYDPAAVELVVGAPLADDRAGAVLGWSTGAYGLDVVSADGDDSALAPTQVTVWPDRDRDGQAALDAEGITTCPMHTPQDLGAPGGAEAWVDRAILRMDCDDANPTIRRGAPDRANDGVDQNCDGADGRIFDFPPVATDCYVADADGVRVSDGDHVVTADTLRAVALGMDPEGAPVSWTLTWRDASEGELAQGPSVSNPVVLRGRALSVSCAPRDATQDGAPIESDAVPVHNAPPRVLACTTGPTSPTTSTPIAATFEAYDPEGDPITPVWSWLRDEAPLAGVNSQVVDPALTERGQRFAAVCGATDGQDLAAAISASPVMVGNEAPLASAAAVLSADAVLRERSTLTCAPTGADPDGDAITWTFGWTVDGLPVHGVTSPTLTGAAFDRDELVRCTATPHDGVVAGAPAISEPRAITNTAPALTTVAVRATDGGPARETATLTCAMLDAVDDDGDPITLLPAWSVNGANAGVGASLTGALFSRGDSVACAGAPFDGTDLGAVVNSSAVPVVNSPPSLAWAKITPVVADSEDGLVCTMALPAVDPDGDAVSYAVSWTRDGAPWTGTPTSTTLPDDTVPAGLADAADWACTIEADDGQEASVSDTADRQVFLAWERTQVRVGVAHACYVLDNGAMRCQGRGTSGQLGIDRTGMGDHVGDASGELGTAASAVLLPTGLTVELLALGADHTCVVASDGEVYCFGANESGQLGVGSVQNIGDTATELGDNLVPADLPVHDGIAQIEAMGSNTCVRTVDGELYCWGANAWGQLGQGNIDPIGDGPDELANLNPVDLGAGRYAIDLTLGNEFTCALLDDHTVRCWGRNGFGQLGQGTTQARGDGPGEMGAALVTTDLGPGTVVDVESGGQHSCALFADGTIKCWGHSSEGKIGLGAVGHKGDGPGEMGTALPVVNLGSGLLVRSLAVGTANNCAILTTGQWKCWGSNANGANANNQITGAQGDNIAEMGNTLTFRSLPNSGVPAQLELGSQGGCAITTCGAVHCWGENATGRVGVGNTAIQRLPAAAVALPAGRLGWEDYVCP